MVAGAGAVTHVEKIPFGDALYFALVTGLTIGYGDVIVKTTLGRWIALMIGLVGILFTGLMVAVLVHAVQESMKKSGNAIKQASAARKAHPPIFPLFG